MRVTASGWGGAREGRVSEGAESSRGGFRREWIPEGEGSARGGRRAWEMSGGGGAGGSKVRCAVALEAEARARGSVGFSWLALAQCAGHARAVPVGLGQAVLPPRVCAERSREPGN